MKRFYWLMVSLPLIFAGCGGVDWFPTTTTNSGSSASPASLTMAFNPNLMLEGSDSTLTFTITNGTGNPAQSGLSFTNTLPSGLAATAAAASQCGGSVTASGSNITFTGGSLASGTASCTVTATIQGAANGNTSVTYTDGAGAISGLSGNLKNSVTDQTLKIFPFSKTNTGGTITASNIIVTPNASQSNVYDITVDVNNTGTTAANVTVDVVAVDANGQIIASTNTSITSTVPVPTGGLTVVLQTASPLTVPLADNAKIKLWTIFSVQ